MKKLLTKEEITHLVQRLAQGDAVALDTFYRVYFGRLKKYGLQIAGKEQADIVTAVIQEFFMWLVQHHQKMAAVTNFELYLFKSIRHNILSTLQKQTQKQAVQKKYLARTQELTSQTLPSPESQLIDKETQQEIKILITQQLELLPSYQQEVLYLRYFQNYSYKEIGEILSVNEQVARNYAYRAIKVLKAAFPSKNSFLDKSGES